MSTEITLTNMNEIVEASKNCCNEYHEKRINEGIKFFNEVLIFSPCLINVTISIHENEQGKKLTYLERVNVFLKHDFLKIEISFDEYRKKYHIFAHFHNVYANIDHYQRREIEQKITSPKKIGVLTSKKINEWIKYHEEINELLKSKNDINSDKIDQFKKRLIGLTLNVQWYKNGNAGYIDNKEKGLRYNFDILENGYIKEDIQITKSNNLDTFLNLL